MTYLEKGKKISVILDTGLCNNINKLTKNSDLAILESTFLEESGNEEKLAKEYKHLTAKQAAEIAKKAKVKELILTHLSQRYEEMPEKIEKFFDPQEWRKIREVIRIVNEFPGEPKPFEFKKVGWMTSHELDDLTRAAQQAVKESGQSLNYELVKLINAWFKENS